MQGDGIAPLEFSYSFSGSISSLGTFFLCLQVTFSLNTTVSWSVGPAGAVHIGVNEGLTGKGQARRTSIIKVPRVDC